MMNLGHLSIRKAKLGDAVQISSFGARTFKQAFSSQNTEEDMEAYLSSNFNESKIRSQLLDRSSTFLLAYIDETLVGYTLLQAGNAPKAVSGAKPLELVRIYVDNSFIGNGYGSKLMEACNQEASEAGYDVIWLGVWEKNRNAIEFYRKRGFKIVGYKEFLLGSDIQQDFIMERCVTLVA